MWQRTKDDMSRQGKVWTSANVISKLDHPWPLNSRLDQNRDRKDRAQPWRKNLPQATREGQTKRCDDSSITKGFRAAWEKLIFLQKGVQRRLHDRPMRQVWHGRAVIHRKPTRKRRQELHEHHESSHLDVEERSLLANISAALLECAVGSWRKFPHGDSKFGRVV